jgi:hypothetical protein
MDKVSLVSVKVPTCYISLSSGLHASEDKCSQKQTYRLMHPHVAKLFPEDFRFAVPIDQLPQK